MVYLTGLAKKHFETFLLTGNAGKKRECKASFRQGPRKHYTPKRRITMKKIHRAAIAVLAAAAIVCTAVMGRIVLTSEQTKPEPPDPEPLVINTVERQDDIVLAVMRGEETVFQYAGSVELWKGVDGKAYGIIYLDGEEVTR